KTPALGAVAGIIGSLQATECLKLLLGMGTAYPGTLLQYDGLHGDFDTIPVAQNPSCPWCSPRS
ncbi:ThiF family adenylyltransferase, partial [Eubacterium aggregans]|uniref:ThiF family adenylyltransferase n=1 Tax=Eubacterium aggregans TaxID=81409 RepID=UPI003F35568E